MRAPAGRVGLDRHVGSTTARRRARAGRTGRKKTGLASTKKNREPRSDASGARRGVGVLGYGIIFRIQAWNSDVLYIYIRMVEMEIHGAALVFQ